MAQRVSVPAVVTALLAAAAALASALTTSFTSGAKYGAIAERLGVIQHTLDAQNGHVADLQTKLLLLDGRLQVLERRDGRR